MVEHRPEEAGVPGSSPGPSTGMLQKIFLRVQTYNRHLSAGAMIFGFIADTIFFGRIDLWETQIIFIVYAAICFITIPLLHLLEVRASRTVSDESVQKRPFFRSRLILPLVTQFAFGGFLSGFVIFYGNSASLGASWPFLAFLFLLFLGNEYFHKYHSRLVFTSTFFFFALYSYAIFAVPIYIGTITTWTFLVSGIVAVGIFTLFTTLLRSLARERFLAYIRDIWMGVCAVLVLMNVFYFTNILPPLPLSIETSGVYHSVWRIPGAYMAKTETQPWHVRYLGFSPTLHVVLGESVSAYSSVFAPTKLTTTIVHRWQWYDPMQKTWVTKAVITYPIVGGRDGGYRGYSTANITVSGKWQVTIETEDGRRIARIPFAAVIGTIFSDTSTITLK